MFVLLGGAWRECLSLLLPVMEHIQCMENVGWFVDGGQRLRGLGWGKELRAGLRVLAGRTYPGWLQVGMGRGLQPSSLLAPHLHLGDSHPLLPDLVSRWLSPVLLTS